VKRMTSRLVPAAVAALLIAVAACIAASGTVLAQTPAGQSPTTQTPTTQTPTTQLPAGSAPGVQTPPVQTVGGQATDSQGATPVRGSDTDHGTALMLLDRIARVLDDSTNRKASKSDIVGTSGSDDGRMKVVIDRAELDEMRAEIAQIKVLLQSEPQSSVAFRPREKNEAAR